MSRVEIVVPEPVEPTVVITLTLREAVGLNTLLRSGTTSELNEMLGITDIKGDLSSVLFNHGSPMTLGYFPAKLTTRSINLNL